MIVPYLAELGISHLYCSPYLEAVPGSTHGYDVVDHTRLNDELGGAKSHAIMTDALAAHGMGHILDVVPNHMAVSGRANAWWDVLKNGRNSAFARLFDIDWDPPEPRLRGKILLPVLGDHYGRVLEAGEFGLERVSGDIVVRYHDHVFPVAPGSLESLPGLGIGEEAVARVDLDPALMHSLLEHQHYRLAFWHTDLELNYRRFFDINDLVALRMEEPEAFDRVHQLPLGLIGDGLLDGVRIDHVDGLLSPHRYLTRLRERAGDQAYIVVEKILAPTERLPDEWPIEGTTGYDFLNLVTGLLVDPKGEKPLTRLYEDFTGDEVTFEQTSLECKSLVMREILRADIERLVKLFSEVCERHPRNRDYTRSELRNAIRETIASLEVYRTYVDADEKRVSKDDIHYIEDATAAASDRRDELDPDLFEFLQAVLLLRHEGGPEADFAMRFQQSTGSVTAKAIEDTALYRYLRFAALNEVGGEPTLFGVSPDAFHAANRARAERWPRAMLTTSTHDTKRSEDVRARLALLSEIPDRWAQAVRGFARIATKHRSGDLPDRRTEYLLYQTLVGAHPIDPPRAWAYMEKAAREAKVHTSWTAPDVRYEAALRSFVEGVIGDPEFATEVAGFVAPLIGPGRINSLAQTLLRLTSPGVPDTFQGCETWDLSLVDPDNRRAVDFASRRELLAFVQVAEPHDVLARMDDGAPKLCVIHKALGVRKDHARAFDSTGSYEPLSLTGPGEDHAVGFVRGGVVCVIVPRLPLSRPDDWRETVIDLPRGSWRNVLSGDTHSRDTRAGDLLRTFPVALLVKEV